MTLLTATALAACTAGGLGASRDGMTAPGLDTGERAEDGLVVAQRLMDAGEYELALKAYNRAALANGLTVDVLAGMGTANLGLGRLGQAETLLRRAVATDQAIPEVWNNLGVVLIERGKTAEAVQILRTAYALDNGESDSIRDNLRLALAKSENTAYDAEEEQDYKLVRRGSSDYLIRQIP
ncbi:tetratricopeptide repeat protein [Thalassobius vesicularis]|uniref:Tetratricopeptide repeat protein n=1 Tax=Thalassobius vesicularis TaxID=1294297 RepID=A0A4V3UYV6_9RHOB|nr:tetratricopeptide repeat protein [Thalassobius vesicularis]